MIAIYECEDREKVRTIHIKITNAYNLACSNRLLKNQGKDVDML
jgi:hypothetical protein